jgi:hypothetical protein
MDEDQIQVLIVSGERPSAGQRPSGNLEAAGNFAGLELTAGSVALCLCLLQALLAYVVDSCSHLSW